MEKDRCANPNCNNKMQVDFIKIIKPGEKDVYYCSNKCFNDHRKVKYKFTYGKEHFVNWRKIYREGV